MFEGEQINWRELWIQVKNASYYFADKLDSPEQQVVGLLMTNSIEFVVIYLAIVHSGHIAAPIDPVYKKLEIDAIVKQLKPALVVLQSRYDSQISNTKPVQLVKAAAILKTRHQPASGPLLAATDQVASLTFTSGTSGKPKVVPNTHFNQVWSVQACSKVWDWTADDNLLITLPLSHWYGLVMGLAGAVYHGNTLYLRQQSFDAKQVLETLASGQISLFTHTPPGYFQLLEQSGEHDLSKVRLFISGSAPLPPKVWHEFKQRFGVEIIETYGSSETGRIAGNGLGKKMVGSPGRILPGVDMKFGPDNEVLIKSGGVFPGYWHNQAATQSETTSDGYWRTGDIGELKDGFLFLKGRLKERIRRFGYTISPRDVEWALLEYPKIKEAFVLGRQTAGRPNDQIFYFISGDATKDEVLRYCKDNLPFNWRTDNIILLEALPRTRNGKPSLAKLKEMAEETVRA